MRTPGPWELKKDTLSETFWLIKTQGDKVLSLGEIYNEDDAFLVQHAPELLQACRAILTAGENMHPRFFTAAVLSAKAAIRKATREKV